MTDAQILAYSRSARRGPSRSPRSYIAVGGQSLAFQDLGKGPDIVLLHGMLTDLDDMMLSLGALLSRDHHVVAFDRPGHGGSTRGRFAGSLSSQAALVAQAIDALGLDRPILVGHSSGGALALTLAIEHGDRIGGVVALAPLVFSEPRLELALFGPRAIPGWGWLAAETLARPADALLLPILWNGMFLPQKMPASFADVMSFDELSSVREMIATGEDTLGMLPDLWRNAIRYSSCPVPLRVIGGSEDLVVNNRLQGGLLATIAPDCTYDHIQGMGHMLHHFVPERVLALVEGLVAEQPARKYAFAAS